MNLIFFVLVFIYLYYLYKQSNETFHTPQHYHTQKTPYITEFARLTTVPQSPNYFLF